MSAWFYILRLQSGALYVGATTNLEKRYEEHCGGIGCRTTSLDPPVALVYSEGYQSFAEARRREAQVKRWSRAKKVALIAGNLDKLKGMGKSRKRS